MPLSFPSAYPKWQHPILRIPSQLSDHLCNCSIRLFSIPSPPTLPNILQNVGLSSMIITFFMLLPPQFSFVRLLMIASPCAKTSSTAWLITSSDDVESSIRSKRWFKDSSDCTHHPRASFAWWMASDIFLRFSSLAALRILPNVSHFLYEILQKSLFIAVGQQHRKVYLFFCYLAIHTFLQCLSNPCQTSVWTGKDKSCVKQFLLTHWFGAAVITTTGMVLELRTFTIRIISRISIPFTSAIFKSVISRS